MGNTFSVNFTATQTEARARVRDVSDRLRRGGLAPDRAGEVEIALAEAVNNVVEHAYAGATPGPVRVRCSMRNRRLDIRICDTGQPLPDGRLPAGCAADVSKSRADLPEGGFGWFLIRAFATDIRYDRCCGCNHLSLRFNI